jgi:pyridoxine kinase
MADILTPNLTEACILADVPYESGEMSYEALAGLVRRLQKLGPSAVVITGIRKGPDLVNAMAEGEGEVSFLSRKAAGEERPGTGDVFSSIIAGGCIRGWSLKRSVNLAADFVRDCIVRSGELQIPVKNGVCFELLLGSLCQMTDK